MRPEQAASVFRELLQTPNEALGHFAQRAGLRSNFNHQDLAQAQELLQAIAQALASAPGPNWEPVRAAWTGMRSKVGAIKRPAVAQKPAWVRDELPARPSLGDPAPGTEGRADQERQRARFVPVAQPQYVQPPAAAPAPAPAPAPSPQAPPVQQAWDGQQQAPQQPYGESYAQGQQQQQAPGYPQQAQGYPQQAQGYPQQGQQQPSQPQAPGAQQYGGYPQAPRQAPPPAPERRPPPPPQRQAAQPDLSGWSVSRYASFCAACAAFPTRVAQTQAEYGLPDDASRARLDDMWQDRFDDDPTLQTQWEQTFRQFSEQLKKNAR